MDAALRAKLLGHAELASLIADMAWIDRPQASALPFVTATLIARGRNYAHDGWDGLNQTLVQFDIWAEKFSDVVATAEQLAPALEAAETVGGWLFAAAQQEAEHDAPPEDIAGGVTVYRRISEWRVYTSPSEG